MAHIQVEASVRTHQKFLQAGPAASWLWLCGVGYCQDGLTDGFIPFEALKFLGVHSPATLVSKLVKVRLWDQCDGGWRVHDYEKHNRTAAEIADLKTRRGSGGKLGGRPTKETSTETLKVSEVVNLTENPSQIRSSQHRSDQRQINPPDERLDVAFREFQGLYPEARRKGGHMLEQAFLAAVHSSGGASVLIAALGNHLASEQWKTPSLVPGMDTWLREERWRQTLPAKGGAPQRVSHVEAWKALERKGQQS